MKRENTHYDTVSQATSNLIERGYTIDFKVYAEENCIKENGSQRPLSPENFEIDEIHRFEGNTDPGDEMIVYAISSKSHDMKGIILNAFGPYADSKVAKIVGRLNRTE